ncbi:MAG: succinate dehydrogenase, cytochrome b556 subunit [Halieaceae bacterium]
MTLRVNVRSTSKDPRPVNLDIGTIDLPVTAYASITHRVTGVLMFFASFLMLWALDMSLTSEASFNTVAAMLASPFAGFILWAIASVLTYHALAGIKHLIMDAGVGETMRGGVIGARIVFALALAAAVVWGVLIW